MKQDGQNVKIILEYLKQRWAYYHSKLSAELRSEKSASSRSERTHRLKMKSEEYHAQTQLMAGRIAKPPPVDWSSTSRQWGRAKK